MLHNKDAVKVVSETLPSFQQTSIILDPVMISTSGSKLLEDDAIRTIMDELFPKATLLTPNIPETEYLSGIKSITRRISYLPPGNCRKKDVTLY